MSSVAQREAERSPFPDRPPAVVPPAVEEIEAAELPDDATVWEKRMQALTMRNAGATWARIAQNFDISTDRAQRWVRAAVNEVVKLPTDQMVDRQRAILLDITRRNYPEAMGDGEGARDAQATIIKCLEHEAKLYGLYAPQRVAVGISEGEFGQNAADLLKLVGFGPLAEIAGIPQADLRAALSPSGAAVSTPASAAVPEPLDVEVDETDIVIDPGAGWSNLD